MKTHYYFKSLRKTIIQFLDVFNDIRIARYDTNGNITKYVDVPLKFSPKMKSWYWIHERKDDEMLPIMSCEMTSVDYAPDRQVNRLKSIVESESIDDGVLHSFLNPVPYNIGFQLSIWGKYMIDIDQILEQILPFFEPFINIKININQLDANFDIKVFLNSVSPEINSEYSDEEIRVLIWNLDFTVQGYMFRPLTDTKIIEKIITKIYTDEDNWNDYRFSETVFTSGGGYENVAMLTKALGYDEDGEILSSYERWGD